ncbi:MAG: redoxin domain-containing protein [Syntrophaceae bacterium]|nr:redoxin domain-containing protein [Syntrophaceae bacterium]
MMKKIKISLFVIALLICLPASSSLGQYNPNASFKTVNQDAPDAPDFSLRDLQGKVFKLSNYRGKPVLIFFGTTWCPSCRKELAAYKEIYQIYTKRGLEVAYINIMESQAKVARFAKANALPFRVLLDEDGAVGTSYSVVGVPTLVLIDKKGKFIKTTHSAMDLPLKSLFPVK